MWTSAPPPISKQNFGQWMKNELERFETDNSNDFFLLTSIIVHSLASVPFDHFCVFRLLFFIFHFDSSLISFFWTLPIFFIVWNKGKEKYPTLLVQIEGFVKNSPN